MPNRKTRNGWSIVMLAPPAGTACGTADKDETVINNKGENQMGSEQKQAIYEAQCQDQCSAGRQTARGHVYVFRAGETNLFKVGGTTNSPLSRIREIQTGCPYPLELFAGFESDDCWSCERKMHDALAEHRTIGEWFDVTPDAMYSAIDSLFAVQMV